MPSPFPGMNPYIENADVWEDFHLRFIAHAADRLAAQAGEAYIVKGETRLILHELSAEERKHFGAADIGIVAPGPAVPRVGVAAYDPPRLRLPLPAVEVVKERLLKIVDRRSRQVVTVVEVLSPSNKTPGPERDAYLAKRNTLTRAGVNLVEIDLRRGGRRAAPPEVPPCDYAMLVARARNRLEAEVWTGGLREPLPRLPIPLAETDPDLVLDLKAVLEETYDRGRYSHHVYHAAPEPPLAPADAAWAAELLGAAGLPRPA